MTKALQAQRSAGASGARATLTERLPAAVVEEIDGQPTSQALQAQAELAQSKLARLESLGVSSMSLERFDSVGEDGDVRAEHRAVKQVGSRRWLLKTSRVSLAPSPLVAHLSCPSLLFLTPPASIATPCALGAAGL